MATTKLILGDCLEHLKEIPDNSIDCILTDPPYGINKKGILNDEDTRLYEKALPDMFRVLRDSTFLVVFVSIGNLPVFIKETLRFFKYRWVFIIYIANGMVRGGLGFNNYQMVLIFQKGEAKIKKPIIDIRKRACDIKDIRSRVHPTQKDTDNVINLLKATSKQSDTILDPFMGSGTTGVACKMLNRNFIGIEIDETYFKLAEKRIGKWEGQERLI